MVVNSSRGPFICNEYDSALVATDANVPAAGIAAGRTHASTVSAPVGLKPEELGIETESFTPSNDPAPSLVSEFSRLGAPNVTPFRYVPVLAPTASTAEVPDRSPSRQYDTGLSPATTAAYPDNGGGDV
jgi:hypothetical protein